MQTKGVFGGMVVLMAAVVCSMAALPRPQNIVIVLADDLGWGDVSCYGATRVKTPSIDRLASEGVRYTDAQSSAATCTPSRFAMMTGAYAWRTPGTRIAPGDAGLIVPADINTLPKMLQGAGYTTGAVGKWHLGLGPGPEKTDWNKEVVPGPREVGFDYSFLLPATGDRTPCVYLENQRVVGLDPDDPIEVHYRIKDGNYPGELDGIKDRDQLKLDWDYGHNNAVVNGIGRIGYMKGGHKARWVDEDMADVLAGKACEFIEKNRDKPFFLYFATHDPHVPRVPHARFAGKTGMGARGDVILQFDYQVGAVMEALEKYGLSENTLLIVTSDNGPVINDGYKDMALELLGDHRPAGIFRGSKYSAYEGGTRVPFVVRWPKQIKAGQVSNQLFCLVDFMSTFAALTGQELAHADAPDSFDLSATLLDPTKPGRETLILQDPLLSMRKGKWKFISKNKRKVDPNLPLEGRLGDPDTFIKGGRDNGSWCITQLYNVEEDPKETNNLVGKYPELAAEMMGVIERAKREGRTR